VINQGRHYFTTGGLLDFNSASFYRSPRVTAQVSLAGAYENRVYSAIPRVCYRKVSAAPLSSASPCLLGFLGLCAPLAFFSCKSAGSNWNARDITLMLGRNSAFSGVLSNGGHSFGWFRHCVQIGLLNPKEFPFLANCIVLALNLSARSINDPVEIP
jgi:hypothetical protein